MPGGVADSELEPVRSVALGELTGAPETCADLELVIRRAEGLTLWAVDDVSQEARFEGRPAWERVLPVWLARSRGARVCVHVSAGAALPHASDAAPGVGELAFVRDHINPSGASPLAGLGESRWGPLFPDQSRVHDEPLRSAALARARELRLTARDVVAACVSGPTLETPAEARMLATLGAHVSVQGLAAPDAGYGGRVLLSTLRAQPDSYTDKLVTTDLIGSGDPYSLLDLRLLDGLDDKGSYVVPHFMPERLVLNLSGPESWNDTLQEMRERLGSKDASSEPVFRLQLLVKVARASLQQCTFWRGDVVQLAVFDASGKLVEILDPNS